MTVCRVCGKELTASAIAGIGHKCAKKYGSKVDKVSKQIDEYKFARESEFKNLGEDIQDSARHKYHEWKGLEEAEKAGEEVAKVAVTRDKLIKNDPPNIEVSEENVVASAIATAAIKRMPGEPTYVTSDKPQFALCKKGSSDNDIIIIVSENEKWLEDRSKLRPGTYVVKLGEVQEEVNKKIRQAYFEKYEWIKNHCEEFSKDESLKNIQNIEDEAQKFDKVYAKTKEFIKDFEEEYSVKVSEYNRIMSSEDADYTNRYLRIDKRRNKKYSIGDAVVNTLASLKSGKSEEVIATLRKAMSGGSLGLGAEKGAKGERFNPIVFYSQELKRVGPEIPAKTKEEMERLLSPDGPLKMRAFQWGNTVSEKERMEHLKRTCESLYDLKDVLGLDDQDLSIGGKLGLAVGARGKSKAMAHYERTHKAINLTRKKGIGALAHEWGHALENLSFDPSVSATNSLGSVPSDPKNYFGRHSDKMKRSGKDTSFIQDHGKFSEELKVFVDRMKKSESFSRMPLNHKKYLLEPAEVFARTFEAMVKRKLEKKGRENTYLVSCSGNDVYPSNEELDRMEPYFDNIINKLTKSK